MGVSLDFGPGEAVVFTRRAEGFACPRGQKGE